MSWLDFHSWFVFWSYFYSPLQLQVSTRIILVCYQKKGKKARRVQTYLFSCQLTRHAYQRVEVPWNFSLESRVFCDNWITRLGRYSPRALLRITNEHFVCKLSYRLVSRRSVSSILTSLDTIIFFSRVYSHERVRLSRHSSHDNFYMYKKIFFLLLISKLYFFMCSQLILRILSSRAETIQSSQWNFSFSHFYLVAKWEKREAHNVKWIFRSEHAKSWLDKNGKFEKINNYWIFEWWLRHVRVREIARENSQLFCVGATKQHNQDTR